MNNIKKKYFYKIIILSNTQNIFFGIFLQSVFENQKYKIFLIPHSMISSLNIAIGQIVMMTTQTLIIYC